MRCNACVRTIENPMSNKVPTPVVVLGSRDHLCCCRKQNKKWNQRSDASNVWRGYGLTPSRERQVKQHPCLTVHMLHGKTYPVLDFHVSVRASKHRKHSNSHRGRPGHGSKKERCLNQSQHFSDVVGVDSGTCEREMTLRW